MAKRARDGKKVATDPAIAKVFEELESSLTFFLGNIGPICAAYSDQLQDAMPHNPKAMRFFEQVGGSPVQQNSPAYPATGAPADPPSPLLQRKSSTVVSPTANDAPGPLDAKLAPSEAILMRQIRILKAESRSLYILFKQINTWLSLSVRPFDDEDNDHNQASQIILGNIPGMLEGTKSVYDMETKYLEAKYELELKSIRHPACESVAKGFQVLESTTWDEIEKGWRMMIRSCLLLHSLISKNMKSLRDPRGGKLNLLGLTS